MTPPNPDPMRRSSNIANILMWAIIAIFTIATAVFCIWASKQPAPPHSIWAPTESQ
jgi:hypothetical protein